MSFVSVHPGTQRKRPEWGSPAVELLARWMDGGGLNLSYEAERASSAREREREEQEKKATLSLQLG